MSSTSDIDSAVAFSSTSPAISAFSRPARSQLAYGKNRYTTMSNAVTNPVEVCTVPLPT